MYVHMNIFMSAFPKLWVATQKWVTKLLESNMQGHPSNWFC